MLPPHFPASQPANNIFEWKDKPSRPTGNDIEKLDYHTSQSQSLVSDLCIEGCCPALCRRQEPSPFVKKISSPGSRILPKLMSKQSEILREERVEELISQAKISNWLDSFAQPPFETTVQSMKRPSEFPQPSAKPKQEQIEVSVVEEGIVLSALRPKPPTSAEIQPLVTLTQNPEESCEMNFETIMGVLDSGSLSYSKMMAQIPHDHLNGPKNLKYISRTNIGRNKTAFFKQSLVIVKDDPQFEIAFKKSEVDEQMDYVRIILYVNNKTDRRQVVDVKYEYDEGKYEVMISSRLKVLMPNRQGREELSVKLKDIHKTKPMSFIVVHFKLGESLYDILLPVLFLKFEDSTQSHRHHNFNTKTLKVIPCKHFASPHTVYSLLPMTYLNEADEVEFLQGNRPYKTETGVTSRESRQTLKLDWYEGALKVTGSENWVDMLAWLLADTRL